MDEAVSNKRVALLRGVNVGGVKVLMAPLKALCEKLGWKDVQTYIASGNLIFRANGSVGELAASLQDSLSQNLGRTPKVLVMDEVQFSTMVEAHPFAPEKGNLSHIYFCWGEPVINDVLYNELKTDDEELLIIDGHVHFHAPNGMGTSKLADKLDKVITGTEITGRNLNTVRKLKLILES